MIRGVFYRNNQARDHLELFLVSAASSLLLVRFYLFATGYPQIGGGGFHIAHMLWGGLIMMAAIAISLSFLGRRARWTASVVGGIGFGVFIDELGKFITHDNDYFYEPTIGLIYGIFIVIYLTFNFIGRTRPLTSREYQLNALSQLEEAVVRNMDPYEKSRVKELLDKADQTDPLTKQLQRMLETIATITPPQPSPVVRWWRAIRKTYLNRWDKRNRSRLIKAFFIAEVLVFVAGGVASLAYNIGSVTDVLSEDVSLAPKSLLGQLASSIVAAGFVAWGVMQWPRSRLAAYEQFRRATLVNLFLTQFFTFARLEFLALPGFVFNLALLGCISYAMREHRR